MNLFKICSLIIFYFLSRVVLASESNTFGEHTYHVDETSLTNSASLE
jgi:hypothetical protein